VRRAFIEQIEAVEKLGGRIILMASRALAAVAAGPDDYLKIYGELIDGCSQPVILHWLGEVFDPALAGYWGSADIDACSDTVLSIIQANPAKVEGIKVSLLEKRYEIDLRKRLPAGVLMYTGDDFNYPELMAGDDTHVSHGLLGIFDSIAPVAAQGLERLAAGDKAGFLEILEPTVPLARKIFEAGLAERPSGPLHPGRRPAVGPLDPPLRRGLPPGRPSRPAARPGPSRLPHGPTARGLRHRGGRLTSGEVPKPRRQSHHEDTKAQSGAKPSWPHWCQSGPHWCQSCIRALWG
jgi:hypothetical protein